MIFEKLRVWHDVVWRTGPENMAADEWLMGQLADGPVLRLYGWAGDWASYGYFQEEKTAREIFGGDVSYVRRWTGGGAVDHRRDATYTLAMPKDEAVAKLRGGGSYRAIHEALAACLRARGKEARLVENDCGGDSAACFEKPVCWDLLGAAGKKLAGAGQRRGRAGFLHQGSVAASEEELAFLPDFLAAEWDPWKPAAENWQNLVEKYL